MAILLVDACDGSSYTEYFDDDAVCHTSLTGNTIEIVGNREFLILLARQMIYFASNDFCLPYGSHIHYDASSRTGYHGLEFILEVMRAPKIDIIMDSNETLRVEIVIPQCVEELCEFWGDSSKVYAKCSFDSVHILGNAKGLIFISTVLLFLVKNGKTGSSYTCSSTFLEGWHGINIKFALG